jgi:prevent-host-death family protein
VQAPPGNRSSQKQPEFAAAWLGCDWACDVIALPSAKGRDILVSMTRKASNLAMPTAQPPRSRWRLQDAKARFSELVRMAHSDGPQHVTLHGRDAVVVVDADEFDRLQGARTGELLIEALQASPHRQLEIEPRRSTMPVRAVKL